ncbi:hypothetical protein FEM48_Zijuj10G0114900 [Ziziphus jujuba var. spinosa]|uniref:Vacuolar iron transporter n=1 Tax=Ziziphus jujuba var. spinosa TaxID=714518 RepID=A0A978UN44_ZIZJJ|nr:hypothetical protein FEM48_Zijuj10G0114900 [Ziziphus jujuba var. spinosa]
MEENGFADLEKQMLLLHDVHEEKHFTSSEVVRDIIIGVSDGLTVPFALAAGLSGADVSSSIILIAGVAEVAAEAAEVAEILAQFELGLEKPDPMRALQSALTIAISYIMGGVVPLMPYMVIPAADEAVVASVILTIVALLIFGFAKGYFTGSQPFKSAMQTALIGAIASAAAYSIAKVFRA